MELKENFAQQVCVPVTNGIVLNSKNKRHVHVTYYVYVYT